MKTNIDNRSSEIDPNEERKSLKVSLPAIATKGLKTMSSAAEEESCFKKCVTARNYNIEHEKASSPGKNGHSRREIGPANQIDNKSPIKKFTSIDKDAYSEMQQQEDQDSCLASVPRAAHDSRDELLPEKIVQDKQVLQKEMMDTLNHGAAQDEKSSEKNKEMKITNKNLKARKAEFKKLKQETTMFSQELHRRSTMCMHLVDDNKLLMDELKKMCNPSVIEILEAKDPAGKDTRTN